MSTKRYVIPLSLLLAAALLLTAGFLSPGASRAGSGFAAPPAAASWLQVITGAAPPGRIGAGMAYDSDRRVAVLFGGDNTGYARLNDTWEFNGTSWLQRSPSQSPPGRTNIWQGLVYDSARHKTVLFGGLAGGYLDDTWEYNGSTWQPVSLSTRPAARDAHAMAFDSRRGVTVLFGGYSLSGLVGDTWEYDGAWRLANPAQKPANRYQHTLAYDSSRGVIVLFGGRDSSGTKLTDTWEYNGTTWQQRFPAVSPPGREAAGMTFDSARGVTVLFGGFTSDDAVEYGRLNDTWEYDGTTWRQISTTQAPVARGSFPLVYDSQQAKAVVFGGGYWSNWTLTTFNDTWEYPAQSSGPTPTSTATEAPGCVNTPTPHPPFTGDLPPAAIVQRHVAHCMDDAGERRDKAEVFLDWSYIPTGGRPGDNPGDGPVLYYGGFIFRDVRIPVGARIISATLQLNALRQYGLPVKVTIAGHDRANSPDFSSTNWIMHDRLRTDARVPWTLATNVYNWQSSPDIGSIIQEIIQLSDWRAGNDIGILVDPATQNETNYATWNAYDGVPADSARLLVSYATPLTPTPTPTTTNVPTTTPTATPSPTPTAAATSTATPTATATPAPTSTPTATSTASATPTATSTASATPTATPTASATLSTTASPTPTASLTPTTTPTATPARGEIRGRIWYDRDGNGVPGPGEPGLLHVTVKLLAVGVQVDQATTQGDGSFSFADLLPGPYTVAEVQPAWLRWSTTPNEAPVTVASGQEVEINFGDWNGLPAWLPLIVQ